MSFTLDYRPSLDTREVPSGSFSDPHILHISGVPYTDEEIVTDLVKLTVKDACASSRLASRYRLVRKDDIYFLWITNPELHDHLTGIHEVNFHEDGIILNIKISSVIVEDRGKTSVMDQLMTTSVSEKITPVMVRNLFKNYLPDADITVSSKETKNGFMFKCEFKGCGFIAPFLLKMLSNSSVNGERIKFFVPNK